MQSFYCLLCFKAAEPEVNEGENLNAWRTPCDLGLVFSNTTRIYLVLTLNEKSLSCGAGDLELVRPCTAESHQS